MVGVFTIEVHRISLAFLPPSRRGDFFWAQNHLFRRGRSSDAAKLHVRRAQQRCHSVDLSQSRWLHWLVGQGLRNVQIFPFVAFNDSTSLSF